jgi:IMP dehydrogenase
MEIEIGRAKRARRVYAFDDVAVVPSRRTRDPEDVSVSWTIDAYQFAIPFLAAPMDSVVSPTTAIMMGQLGGLGVLDLEGLWTRYEDPEPLLAEIRELPAERATNRMQEIYSEPIKPELVTRRLAEIREGGVTVAGALSPQRTQELYETVVEAGVDLFVIRGTTVSAEHVSKNVEPLNLKKFIYELDVPASTRPWPPRSRTSPAPAGTTWTSPAAATCTSSPTAASGARATSSRRSPAARTR